MSESFVAFRTMELRGLASQLSGDEFKIYVLMATYADRHHARCWPGIPELMEQSGYSKGTVERARNSLERKGLVDCIARDRKDELTGRQLPNVYQICGPLHLKNQMAVPKPVPSVKHESSITRFKNQNQLTRFSEPESVTSSSKPRPASRGLQKESADAKAVPTEDVFTEDVFTSEVPTELGEKQQQNNEKAAKTPKPQKQKQGQGEKVRASEINHKRDLSPYHAPLADMEREHMAARIAAECDTTTPIAREMASKWPLGQVEAALSEMRTAAQEGRIKKSKYGFALWQLEHSSIAPEDVVKTRRTEALKRIQSGDLLTDHNTGEQCHFVRRMPGDQLLMAYDDAQYTVTLDQALALYQPDAIEDQ